LASRSQAWLWLGIFSAAGVALAIFYPDSYQQDGGHHYLFARNAWLHHAMFVGVWARPLFTSIYAFPALLGYQAAKIFTVLICVLTGYQTFRVAEATGIKLPALSIPLMFLQPSFLLLSADTMTEPIFALVFITALRLHLAGRVVAGMIVASMMILARPEGFFLGILWGIWALLDGRSKAPLIKRIPSTLLLAGGVVIWWLAAWIVTGDPLYIKHSWPVDWAVTNATYGTGSVATYITQLPTIVGPLLCLVFLYGLAVLLFRGQLAVLTSSFLFFFGLHSVLRVFGFFGAAGYARYFVCISPAIALITLVGWNEVATWMRRTPRFVAVGTGATVLLLSAGFTVSYIDATPYTRDARAVQEMYDWFQANPRPVKRLVWSQAYMCILFDCDIADKPPFNADTERNLRLLRESPKGTLIFWDGETGPSWYKMRPADLESAGYIRLRSKAYDLSGLLLTRWWFHDWGARPQEMHLFYKAE